MENKKITPVIEKHYKLILWMLPKMANFPKDQKFLLADRIERILLDILEMLIEANYSKDKRGILIKVNLKLDVLRFMMRVAKDMKYVNINAYDFFCQSGIEIGKMVGGWLKSTGCSLDKINIPESLGLRTRGAEYNWRGSDAASIPLEVKGKTGGNIGLRPAV